MLGGRARGVGAGLAAACDRLAESLAADEALRREVAAALAAPRATARLLAGLPLVGLALGAGLGAHPLRFLLGSGLGRACLLAAAVLDVAGLAWTRRLAAGAQPP